MRRAHIIDRLAAAPMQLLAALDEAAEALSSMLDDAVSTCHEAAAFGVLLTPVDPGAAIEQALSRLFPLPHLDASSRTDCGPGRRRAARSADGARAGLQRQTGPAASSDRAGESRSEATVAPARLIDRSVREDGDASRRSVEPLGKAYSGPGLECDPRPADATGSALSAATGPFARNRAARTRVARSGVAASVTQGFEDAESSRSLLRDLRAAAATARPAKDLRRGEGIDRRSDHQVFHGLGNDNLNRDSLNRDRSDRGRPDRRRSDRDSLDPMPEHDRIAGAESETPSVAIRDRLRADVPLAGPWAQSTDRDWAPSMPATAPAPWIGDSGEPATKDPSPRPRLGGLRGLAHLAESLPRQESTEPTEASALGTPPAIGGTTIRPGADQSGASIPSAPEVSIPDTPVFDAEVLARGARLEQLSDDLDRLLRRETVRAGIRRDQP